MLARGANVNAENGDRKTPLHVASKDKKIVHLLTREGADIHAPDNNDSMPFQVRPAGLGAHGRRSRSQGRTQPGGSFATATRGLSFRSGLRASDNY
jgi:Ankyrin repeat